MKKVFHLASSSSSSSAKSSSVSMEGDQSETRADSCYYPGCRKDANCECEICLASINATLDLMPTSFHKSSLTNLSASRTHVQQTPVAFDPLLMSTPTSNPCKILNSPLLKSTARMSLNLQEKTEETEEMSGDRCSGYFGFGGMFFRAIVVLILFLVLTFGVFRMVSGFSRPVLSLGIVRKIGRNSGVAPDLNSRLSFLQRELQSYGVDHRKVTNCSFADSKWKIDQNGLLLISHCSLYKSVMEEVRIWGWPLQTAGLLTTGFSSPSFTILTGRVTEWADGKVGYSIRKANTSWVQRSWSASVVQLDPNTWVLEYRRSLILEKSRLFSGMMEFLKFRMSRVVRKMKQELWLLSAFETHYTDAFTPKNDIMIPT